MIVSIKHIYSTEEGKDGSGMMVPGFIVLDVTVELSLTQLDLNASSDQSL